MVGSEIGRLPPQFGDASKVNLKKKFVGKYENTFEKKYENKMKETICIW